MKYSNFSNRFFAFILDVLILGLPFILISSLFIFPILLGEEIIEILKSQSDLSAESLFLIYSSGIKVEIAMIFTWGVITSLFLISNNRATPGKKIMKIQVVNSKGEKVKFSDALGRVVALPLIILTIQAPERYMIYENFDKLQPNQNQLSLQENFAYYLQTPISGITNILTLFLIVIWFVKITRDKQNRAVHDMLFDTRVINVG